MKIKPNRDPLRTMLRTTALTAVLFAFAAQAPAQSADIVIDPAETHHTPATPTLKETKLAFAADIEVLVAGVRDIKMRLNECVAAAIHDAGNRAADLQRKACEASYAEGMLDHHHAVQARFDQAALAFWAQEDLIGNELLGIDAELEAVRAEKTHTEDAAAMLIQGYRQLLDVKGKPVTPEERDPFDELEVAHREATIRLGALTRRETGLLAGRAGLELARGQMKDLGFELKMLARSQRIPIAYAEARLVALGDDTRGDWRDRAGSPTGMTGIAVLIKKLSGFSYSPPSEEPAEDRTGPDADATPSITLDLAPGSDPIAYFEGVLGQEVTQ